jgi:hypothetical protein
MTLFLRPPASGTSKIHLLFNKLLCFIDGQLYSNGLPDPPCSRKMVAPRVLMVILLNSFPSIVYKTSSVSNQNRLNVYLSLFRRVQVCYVKISKRLDTLEKIQIKITPAFTAPK